MIAYSITLIHNFFKGLTSSIRMRLNGDDKDKEANFIQGGKFLMPFGELEQFFKSHMNVKVSNIYFNIQLRVWGNEKNFFVDVMNNFFLGPPFLISV